MMKAIRPETSRIVLALILCASLAIAQESDDQAKKAADAEHTARKLRDRILAEAATLPNHPWAGEYHCGDGIVKRQDLYLAPGAGFLLEWSSCSGLHYRNYGPVKVLEGGIKLCGKLEYEGDLMTGKDLPDEFVFVDWAPSHYLVPAKDLLGFCNAINRGVTCGIPGDFYFVRGGYGTGPGSGLPQVPKDFQSYLLAAPVCAEIISIDAVTTRLSRGRWVHKDTSVTLNAGVDKGLREGMLMYVQPFKKFRVTAVAESTAQAVLTESGSREGDKHPGAEKGWLISSTYP